MRFRVVNKCSVEKTAKEIDFSAFFEEYSESDKMFNDICSAVLKTNSIILKTAYWICPCCQAKVKLLSSKQFLYRELIDEVFNKQISLIQDCTQKNFFTQKDYQKIKCCPYCGTMCSENQEETFVIISFDDNNVLKISRKISSIPELFRLSWLKIVNTSSMPLFETINLDFNSGETNISLSNNNGNTLCCKEVSANFIGFLSIVVNNNLVIKKAICNSIAKLWNINSFPYNAKDLSLNRLIELTRFVGFSRDFYDNMPKSSSSGELFDSFQNAAKNLHCFETIIDTYHTLDLPSGKSIKKLLLENPQLMFYCEEIKAISRLFKRNVDLISTVLNSSECYNILAYLHIYPCAYEYFYDFVKSNDKAILCRRMTCDFKNIFQFAFVYAAMRPEMRRQIWKERIKPSFNEDVFCELFPVPFYIPMKVLENRYECSIDGYYFTRLKNAEDFIQAGKELQNCLGTYSSFSNPVILVKKGSKSVAAIEVKGSQVVQALAFENEPIKMHSKLSDAIHKYFVTMGLKY